MAIFEEMSVKEDSGPRSMNDPDKISEKSHKLPSLTLYYRERCKKYKTSSFLQLKKKTSYQRVLHGLVIPVVSIVQMHQWLQEN